jgi:hypothetical protein
MSMRLVGAAVALLLVVSGCGNEHTESSPDTGGWQQLADPPLSPRWGPVAAAVDGVAVFVGGDVGDPCPPGAGCAAPPRHARDGVAYDLGTDTWRRLPDAPAPIAALAPHAVVGDCLYVLSGDRLLRLDLSDRDWTVVPTPSRLDWADLVAHGDDLVVVSGSDEQGVRPDRVLDTRNGRWSVLPEDPIGPAFARGMVSTPAGLVLTAHELVDQPGSEEPSVLLAARYDDGSRTWTRLPDSDQLGGGGWSWTGEHLVDATPGGADGGEVNGWGRTVPYGGTLDPVTGEWSRLPDPPAELTGGWPVHALGGPVVATAGWLFDDRDGTWTRVRRPRGAPPQPGPAVWLDGTVLVHGGLDWDRGTTAEDVYSTGFWALTP